MTIGFATRRSERSRAAAVAAGLFGVAIFGATPQAPAEATTPSCVVPFLAASSSALVAGVTTVTATANSSVATSSVFPTDPTEIFSPWRYYFSTAGSRIRLVLTFSPALEQVAVDPEFNNDAPGRPVAFERFTLKAFDATSGGTQVGSTVTAENSDATETLSGAGANIARLEIDYAADSATDRASLLNVLLPGTCPPTLSPASQTVSGTINEPFTATATLGPAGFGGAVTYAVTSGTLPAGLTLNTATGVVSGTPTAVGASTVTITGTGATSGSATATISFTISEPTPPPAEPIPRLALNCTPDPVVAGSAVSCDVSNGDANIDILWSATTVIGVAASRGVTLDVSGTATFAFVAPSGAQAIDVELVAWGVSDSVQVVGGPVPSAVPAGEGRGGTLPAVPLLALATVLVLVASRFRTRAELVAPLPR